MLTMLDSPCPKDSVGDQGPLAFTNSAYPELLEHLAPLLCAGEVGEPQANTILTWLKALAGVTLWHSVLYAPC